MATRPVEWLNILVRLYDKTTDLREELTLITKNANVPGSTFVDDDDSEVRFITHRHCMLEAKPSLPNSF